MTELTAVNLAHVSPFSFGSLEVHPSLCEVVEGLSRESIEPRVMQVLVALTEADGAVVTRDELIQRCWAGRAISEDALNRVIAKVRRVASGPGRDAFHIETVTKVGYRLVRRELSATGDGQAVAPATPPPRPGHWLIAIGIAAAAGLTAIGASVAVVKHESRPVPPALTHPLAAPIVAAASDLETRGLSAVFEGTPDQTAEGIGYLRQATAIAPAHAEIWGSLAMAYVLSLPHTPADEQAAVVSRVREAALRAKAIDRNEGRSSAALVSLEPDFRNWLAKDEYQRRALASAPPQTPPLMYQRVQFLAGVGRTHEALAVVDQLAAASPLLPWIQAARAELLAADGRLDEAEQVADRATEIWPRERLTWFTRFYLAAYGARPDRALALAADQKGWPRQTDRSEIALAVRVAKALQTRSNAETDALLRELRPLAEHQQGYAELAIRIAAALGRPDDAMAFARRLYTSPMSPGPRSLLFPRIGFQAPGERNTSPLFFPPANMLWQRADFLPLMANIGLVDYWRRTEAPDFCRIPTITDQCRKAGLTADLRSDKHR